MSVTHLTFGDYFDQPIDSCIPGFVTHLTFGCYFNKPINGCIPDSVTHLTFGSDFDQPIDQIPDPVKNISLHENYKQKISDELFSKITIRD